MMASDRATGPPRHTSLPALLRNLGLRPSGRVVVNGRCRAWCDCCFLLAWYSAGETRKRVRGASGWFQSHFGGRGRPTGWIRTGPSSFGRLVFAFTLRKGRVDALSAITSVVVVHCSRRGGTEETGCFGRLEVAPRKGCCQPFARAGSLPLGRIGSPRVALHFGRVTGNRCSLDATPSGGGSRPWRSFLHVARRWRQTRCSLRAAPR